MSKKIFIAATKQNDGKTTASLGLIFALQEKFKRIGFIKPIGQRYLEEDGFKVDEDSVLIERVLKTIGEGFNIADMSPIAVERGFTEKYIINPDKKSLTKRILDSYRRVSKNKDLVVVEGTGHAGVGSVFDHSNSAVARLLKAKVVLISSGGIGRPIDEILLNKAVFDQDGVDFLGVIINKVLPDKFDKINSLVRKGLSRKKIDVLGVIPYMPVLSYPTISQILEETDFKLLSGKNKISNIVKKIIVAAMEPHEAMNYMSDLCFVITPGDREDILLTAISCYLTNSDNDSCPLISGIILTGGITPHSRILKIAKKADVPLLFAQQDTYKVASIIHDLTIKTRPEDKEKIELIKTIIKDNVDIERLTKWV